MTQEALKLALEAFAQYMPYQLNEKERIAQAAIKEALAQPEQEPDQKRPQNCGTGYCSCIECVMKPSPRAWLIEFENGDEELHFDEQSVGEIHVPLYTTPPQSRRAKAFKEIAEKVKSMPWENDTKDSFLVWLKEQA